jgi:hypothetical protein
VQPTTDQITAFISKWSASKASERAHAQSFMRELCALLDVPEPEPAPAKGKESFAPSYGFERAVRVKDDPNTKFIDLYRADCFIWENKQLGGRGTNGWLKRMEEAFQQAARYARGFATPRAPFIVTCDIGHVFEVWSDFSRQGEYGGYAARKTIPIADLTKEEVRTWLRTLWLDPMSLDPARGLPLITFALESRDTQVHAAPRWMAFRSQMTEVAVKGSATGAILPANCCYPQGEIQVLP